MEEFCPRQPSRSCIWPHGKHGIYWSLPLPSSGVPLAWVGEEGTKNGGQMSGEVRTFAICLCVCCDLLCRNHLRASCGHATTILMMLCGACRSLFTLFLWCGPCATIVRQFSTDSVGLRASGFVLAWKGLFCNTWLKTIACCLWRGSRVKVIKCFGGCKLDVGDVLLSVSACSRHTWPFHGDGALWLLFHDWCDF